MSDASFRLIGVVDGFPWCFWTVNFINLAMLVVEKVTFCLFKCRFHQRIGTFGVRIVSSIARAAGIFPPNILTL